MTCGFQIRKIVHKNFKLWTRGTAWRVIAVNYFLLWKHQSERITNVFYKINEGMKSFTFKLRQTTWQINYWFAGLIISYMWKSQLACYCGHVGKLSLDVTKIERNKLFKTKFTVKEQTKFSQASFHTGVATCSQWTLKIPSLQTVSTPFHRLFILPHPLPRAKQTNLIGMKSSFSRSFFRSEALVAATKLCLFKGASQFYFPRRRSFTVEWQTQ